MRFTDFVTLSVFLILLMMFLILALFTKSLVKRELANKDRLLHKVMEENKDLMNRLKSSDLATYQTMTYLTNSQNSPRPSISDEYHSQSDEAEMARLHGFAQQGLGEVIYDDVTDQDDLNLLLENSGYVLREPQN